MSIVNQGTILQTRQTDESLQPSIIKGFPIYVSQHTHNVGAGTHQRRKSFRRLAGSARPASPRRELVRDLDSRSCPPARPGATVSRAAALRSARANASV